MSSYHENTFLIIVLHCFSCIVHCIVYKTCNDKNALCRFLDPAVRDEQPWQSSKYVYFFYYSKKQYKIEKLKRDLLSQTSDCFFHPAQSYFFFLFLSTKPPSVLCCPTDNYNAKSLGEVRRDGREAAACTSQNHSCRGTHSTMVLVYPNT